MGTSDLPDIYARRPRAVRIYQANHECACYNFYVTRPFSDILSSIMNSECVVSNLLLWKDENKFLSLDNRRKFCLGIVRWCPCVDCTDPEMACVDPSKPLSCKQKPTTSKLDESDKEPVAS